MAELNIGSNRTEISIMETAILDIASEKTADPRQLEDLDELRRCVLAVAVLERSQTTNTTAHQVNGAVLAELGEVEQAKEQVLVLQARFCRQADTASEAIQSIVGFEREELDFLHLLSDLSANDEQSQLQPLLRSKEELVDGMVQFIETWT
jgi:hypothetical protein